MPKHLIPMPDEWKQQLEPITPPHSDGGFAQLVRFALIEYADKRGIQLEDTSGRVGVVADPQASAAAPRTYYALAQGDRGWIEMVLHLVATYQAMPAGAGQDALWENDLSPQVEQLFIRRENAERRRESVNPLRQAVYDEYLSWLTEIIVVSHTRATIAELQTQLSKLAKIASTKR